MVAEKYLIIVRREIQRTLESIEYFDKTNNIPGSEKSMAYWEGRHDMAVRCQSFLEDILDMERAYIERTRQINQKELSHGRE